MESINWMLSQLGQVEDQRTRLIARFFERRRLETATLRRADEALGLLGMLVDERRLTRRRERPPLYQLPPGEYQGLRITPNVYTTLEEIDTFADVMEKVIRRGSLPG